MGSMSTIKQTRGRDVAAAIALPTPEIASGEVIATPHAPTPYCAVFRFEGQVLFEWPVDTIEQGHGRIRAALDFLYTKIIERDEAALQTRH